MSDIKTNIRHLSCPSQPTSPERGWFVPPFGGNPWWVYLASALPALLVTILVFMDQQITAVIVNRKEHKLKVKQETSPRYNKTSVKTQWIL